ncbi:MAG: response regulator transcription factor [Bacteroidetes bacterium]|nr:MAG: response regulator transcription factor [Bacteroidota bacterium]
MNSVKILIADDHPIVRKGLKEIIESVPEFHVLAEEENGAQAVSTIKKGNVDVAILDVNMPGMSGIEVAKELQHQGLGTKIIFLTMYKEEDLFNEALDHGAHGYLLKDNATTEIINAIKAVLEGKYYICPAISEYLVNRNARARDFTKEKPGIESLTETERKIIRLIAESKTSKEIAGELYISCKTVENHRLNISNKLGLHGSHSLLKFAFENKRLL